MVDNHNLSKQDINLILSALHVAAGYPMGDHIEDELGFTRAEKNRLFEKIIAIRKDMPRSFVPSKDESRMIVKCLEACLKYIDAWEFPAVMGASKGEFQIFYEDFK